MMFKQCHTDLDLALILRTAGKQLLEQQLVLSDSLNWFDEVGRHCLHHLPLALQLLNEHNNKLIT